MPIYAFACTACGYHFDKLQKLSDPDPETCPHCGAAGTVKRQLTAPSFRLAGSGWYETDFKKDGDRKRNLAGDAATSDAAPAKGERKATDSKSPDSKPADAKPADAKPATPAPATPSAKSETPSTKRAPKSAD